MSFFGGGGGGSQPAAPSSQTQFVREAPGIEERKIELMDIARQVAQKPIDLPDYQIAGLGSQAVTAGAFGGGREGVQQAELQGRILSNMGQAQAQGFNTALSAAQNQQRVGLAAGQQLGQMGALQQQMAQGDIQQLMAAGGVQRQLAQQVLDAQRQSTLQQQYEPYQRAEFLSNLYAAGPKSSSQLTMGSAPTQSPLAQAVGTGIGAFTAFQGMKQAGQSN